MNINEQRGTTTVELSLGGLVLMISTFAIFEICYNIYVVNVTEFALRETIRRTKIYEGMNTHDLYDARFRETLEREGALWHFLIEDDKFELSSRFFKSYENLVNDIGENSDVQSPEYVLAEVTLTYNYAPMITIIPRDNADITRTMLLNLEHEGWGENE
ncbi:TadE family protein [Photobacterium nomapromontoriensis]|uniref:TadE family protein n=1 Tax=Photobacterium nomapromontoriensis TaxID=2910237 RepID=UPI003D0DD9D3